LPISDVFAGKDLGELLELLRKVVRDPQTIKTDPLLVSIADHEREETFVHTIVPITDADSTTVNRLFLYSEKAG